MLSTRRWGIPGVAGAKTKLMWFKKSVEYTPILREMELNFELRFYHRDLHKRTAIRIDNILALVKLDLDLAYFR